MVLSWLRTKKLKDLKAEDSLEAKAEGFVTDIYKDVTEYNSTPAAYLSDAKASAKEAGWGFFNTLTSAAKFTGYTVGAVGQLFTNGATSFYQDGSWAKKAAFHGYQTIKNAATALAYTADALVDASIAAGIKAAPYAASTASKAMDYAGIGALKVVDSLLGVDETAPYEEEMVTFSVEQIADNDLGGLFSDADESDLFAQKVTLTGNTVTDIFGLDEEA